MWNLAAHGARPLWHDQAVPRKQPAEATDPNKLVRQQAGDYRSADERFEVRGQANRWFLVDTAQSDELGQELVRGPFATLDEVRQTIPEARRAEIKALPTPKAGKPAKGAAAKSKPSPKPGPPSWIDKLPKAEATEVRALIRALEKEGIGQAEQLVRRDRESFEPAVATKLLERRLEALLDEFPAEGREAVRELIKRVVNVLSDEGGRRRDPLPGWLLVEVGPQPAPENRRIRLAE